MYSKLFIDYGNEQIKEFVRFIQLSESVRVINDAREQYLYKLKGFCEAMNKLIHTELTYDKMLIEESILADASRKFSNQLLAECIKRLDEI